MVPGAFCLGIKNEMSGVKLKAKGHVTTVQKGYLHD